MPSPPPRGRSAIFRPLDAPALFALPRADTGPAVASADTDVGDDDSFSPDIVSGFGLHHGIQGEEPAPPSAPHFSYAAPVVEDAGDDVDHREDGIFDELDELGDWVVGANPPPGTDLTKKVNGGVKTGSQAIAGKALAVHERAEDRRREHQARDKLDRATVEQVLDPRTRMILFRLLSRGRLRSLDGCVSTGKEANVYFGTTASNPEVPVNKIDGLPQPFAGLLSHEGSPDAAVAVKVFKTSILQFKDRERYVAGEFRFRRSGYQRGSNRKMVQQWAEKEYRNQMRLQEAGIPSPVPLLLKPPVLIMSFFGKDGWPAPRLKDAALSMSRLEKAYFRVCMLMRRMFHVAKLVHGDLSEYNMLYWKSEIIIIDVSQSVEDDHPMALDFLRRDCGNVNDFFRRNGVVVLGLRELFDLITGEHVGPSEEEREEHLRTGLQVACDRSTAEEEACRADDEVFMRSFIPRTLRDVTHHEREVNKVIREGADAVLYGKLTGLSVTQPEEPRFSMVSSHDAGSSPTESGSEVPVTAHEGPEFDFELCPEVVEGRTSPCIEPLTPRRLGISLQTAAEFVRAISPDGANSRAHGSPTSVDPQVELQSLTSRRSSGASKTVTFDSEAVSPERVPSDCEERFDDEHEGSSDDSDSSTDGEGWVRLPRATQNVDPLMGMTKKQQKEWKKESKKRVKADAREKRENKMPKHVKKRKEALAKRRRGTK